MAEDPEALGFGTGLAQLLLQQPAAFATTIEALAARPDGPNAETLCRLALFCAELDRPAIADRLFELAFAGDPPPAAAAWEIQRHLPRVLIPADAAAIERRRQAMAAYVDSLTPAVVDLLQASPATVEAYLNLWEPFNALSYGGGDPLPLRRAFSRWFESLLPEELRAPLTTAPAPLPRIGFVLNHTAALSFFWLGLLHRLRPQGFEIYLIYTSLQAQRHFQTLNLMPTGSLTLGTGPLLPALRALRGLNLDLLLLTEANTDRMLQNLLACCRLARLQATSLLSSGSTGSSQMDLYLSTRCFDAPAAQAHYSEKLLLFRHMPLYVRPPWFPPMPTRAEFGLPETGALYACPHLMLKLHPDFDAVLGEILRRDPAGLLVLVTNPNSEVLRTQLLERFERSLADVMPRIWFLPKLSPEDFRSLLQLADVMLDPLYFGGGTTTYEALTLGLPMVSWPGLLAVGRTVLGCYVQMGLADCVALSAEQYVAQAVRLGTDARYNRAVRRRLRARQARLLDNEAVLREFTLFFRTIRDYLPNQMPKGRLD